MARRADHTREELTLLTLETASDIVAKQGFLNLTARNLAQSIGYTPGTLYNIFGSMDDVYLQVSAQTLDELYETLNSPACNDPNTSLLENLKMMARIYRQFARDNRNHWIMLFNGNLPEKRYQLDWYAQKIDRLFLPLSILLSPLFSKEQEREKNMAVRTLFSSVHGLCFLQETGRVSVIGQQQHEDEMTDFLITAFVNGINDV